MTVYSFITTIHADSDDAAQEVRSEVVGGGGGVLVRKDLGEVLTKYRAFHDKLGDLIESGKVHSFRDSEPAEYAWMIDAMVEIAALDARDGTEQAGRE